jgi:hypothetical protein
VKKFPNAPLNKRGYQTILCGVFWLSKSGQMMTGWHDGVKRLASSPRGRIVSGKNETAAQKQQLKDKANAIL